MCLYRSLLVLRTNAIPKMMSYKRLKSHWTIATAKHRSKPTMVSATPRNTLFYPYSSPRPIWSYTFTMLQKALFSYNFILLYVICTNLFLFWLDVNFNWEPSCPRPEPPAHIIIAVLDAKCPTVGTHSTWQKLAAEIWACLELTEPLGLFFWQEDKTSHYPNK